MKSCEFRVPVRDLDLYGNLGSEGRFVPSEKNPNLEYFKFNIPARPVICVGFDFAVASRQE